LASKALPIDIPANMNHLLALREQLQKNHFLCALIAFGVFYSLFFAPSLLSVRHVIAGDVYAYYIPTYYSLESLWTNLIYAGYPTFADPQFQTWFPIRALFSLMPDGWSAYTISAYVLASWAIYGYVYRLTQTINASLLAGLIYGMSGFMLCYEGYPSILYAAAWVPVLILSFESLGSKLTARWFLIGTVAVACVVLAGHPQISLYGLMLAGIYALWLGFRAPVGRWRFLRTSLLMGIVGVGLTAIQLLPTLELTRLSLRAEMTFADFVSYSFPIKQAIQIILPSYYSDDFSSIGYFGYLGLIPLLLSLRAAMLEENKRTALLWLAVALVSFLLALGDATPLGYFTYHIPVFNKFRAPVRHFLELGLAVSVLAGMTFAAFDKAYASRTTSTNALNKPILGMSVLLVLSGLWLLAEQWGSASPTLGTSGWLAFSVTFALATVAVFALVWAKLVPPQLLMLFLLFDTVAYGWSLQQWKLTTRPTATTSGVPEVAARYSAMTFYAGQRVVPLRGVLGANAGTLDEIPPNTSMQWKVLNVSGYGPLIQSRYGALTGIDNYGQVSDALLDYRDRTLDMLSARFAFLPENDARVLDPRRWRKVEEEKGAKAVVYENLRVRPHAWLVSEVVQAKPDVILRAIKTSSMGGGRPFDPAVTALTEDPVQPITLDQSAQLTPLQYQDTYMAYQSDSKENQFLVISDVTYPGWQATIDGEPVKIFQTNYVLRGIAIPPGRHTIELRFNPPSLWLGAVVSLVFLAVLGFFCCRLRLSEIHLAHKPV
jgi:hypothetical protein